MHDYIGVVEDGFELRLGNSVKFLCSGLWVVEHPFPLFLFGANILYGRGKRHGVGTMRTFPSRHTLGLVLCLDRLSSVVLPRLRRCLLQRLHRYRPL